MIAKQDSDSGVIPGQPRFILPDLPRCERVGRCTYRLPSEDGGPMHVKVGMAMCNLLPRERYKVAFANASLIPGKPACDDPDGKVPVAELTPDDCRPYRGWLAKIVFFIEREEEPILTLYVDPHEFNRDCIPFDNRYSDERFMRMLGLLHDAFYCGKPNVSANELVDLIQKQCEDTLCSIGMYALAGGDLDAAEPERERIASILSNPVIKSMDISVCHGRLALDWIREKYRVIPFTSEQ